MEKSLKNRVIVIVGGSTGLGFSAARVCVRNGAKVALVGRDERSVDIAVKKLGQNVIGIAGNACDSQTACEAIARAKETFGGFDGLYHVAGGSGRDFGDGPLHELSDEGIDQTIQLNLSSLLKSNRAAVRAMLQEGTAGAILNMGSVLGQFPAARFFATHAYAAAKSAIIGFTKSCAAYYAPKNIRFNVIAPALVNTPMSKRAVGNATITEYIANKQPLQGGRVGRPEDLDAAVVFLLSEASSYVTGQTLTVDGGWSVSDGCLSNEVSHV